MATNNPNDQGSIDDIKKSFERLGNPINEVIKSIVDAENGMESLNRTFVQGRTRLDEMSDAVSKAAAGVIRLGGNISEVSATMEGIAEGSKRNVIATEEQVSKLFAAYQILGTLPSDLVEKFAEVGYETSQIGVNLEGSIKYVQSIGLNAKTVVNDVTDNMEKMNRYQFEGGVAGLTKMAAQASMLRFDMRETFQFAEKVLTPEGAIETAAGFQRLGISIGNLADPFALMNASINDPSGLQDSLIKATKQFTQYDEKTKSFKINPQGVLTLRALAEETNTSFENLAKSALAAADLDKRLSEISPSLNFDNEEDRKLLANMATKKDGEYVVQIKDDQGAIEYKKLGDITKNEFEELRKKQEEGPKTLEEIQISQLDVLKNIEFALSGNLSKGTFGIANADIIRSNIIGAGRITGAVAGAVDKNVPESSKISESVNDVIKRMGNLFTLKDTGKVSNKDFEIKLTQLKNEIKDKSISLGEKGFETLKTILQDANKKVTGSSGIEQEFKRYTSEILGIVGTPKKSTTSKISGNSTTSPITRSSFFGGQNLNQTSLSDLRTKNLNLNSKLEIDIKGLEDKGNSEQRIMSYIDKKLKIIFESQEFKKLVYESNLQQKRDLGFSK